MSVTASTLPSGAVVSLTVPLLLSVKDRARIHVGLQGFFDPVQRPHHCVRLLAGGRVVRSAAHENVNLTISQILHGVRERIALHQRLGACRANFHVVLIHVRPPIGSRGAACSARTRSTSIWVPYLPRISATLTAKSCAI